MSEETKREAVQQERDGKQPGAALFCARLAKLVDVKSVVTLTLTGVFAALALTEVVDGKDFLQVFLIIIGFYFGTQSKKGNGTGEGDSP